MRLRASGSTAHAWADSKAAHAMEARIRPIHTFTTFTFVRCLPSASSVPNLGYIANPPSKVQALSNAEYEKNMRMFFVYNPAEA